MRWKYEESWPWARSRSGGGVLALAYVAAGLVEESDLDGLPGKSGLSSKGFDMSAEKASRSDRICFSISGIGHELEQSSRMRMCRVKYPAAPELISG